MKKYSILIMAFAVFSLTSCKDDDWVRVDSLQVFGNEFYQGETVNLGMSVETSDADNNYYEWFCDEGTLRLSQQGYTVMKWTAPKKNGEYVVGCTVHCHGKKETRTAVIKVNGIFFDRFAGSTLSGWSAASGNSAVLRSGRLETQVSATNTTDSAGSVTKSLGVSAFFPPASITSSLGIVGGTTNANTPKFPVSSANPTWDNFLGFGLTGSDPGVDLSPTYYISEIRVDWWPTTHIQNTVTYYAPEDDPELPAFRTINDTDFNARVAVRWTRRADIGAGIQAYSGWFMTFFDAPALTHDVDVNKVMGLAIDEDYKVFVYVGGTEVFSTTAIQTWQSTHADCPFQISQVKYLYPNYTRVYMNNVVGNNTTELLY